MLKLFSPFILILIWSALAMNSNPVAQGSSAFSSVPHILSHSLLQKRSVVYRTYSNARFKYIISYPVGILDPQGEADNGDGQKFTSKDKKATMLVFGENNINQDSLKRYFEVGQEAMTEGEGRIITYKVLQKNWFVISGRHGNNISYMKSIYRGDTLITFIIEYQAAMRATYDPIVTRISRSFSG